MNPSPLAEGNLALRNKQFEKALHHYRKAEQAQPELAHLIQANIKLATRRLDEERAQKPGEQAIGIDIVVPVFNALEDVKVCLASLQSHTDGFRVRVIVVNDGSDEATTQWLREFCEGKQIFSLIEHPTNFGYTRAVNSGLKASTAPYVITQNSDTIVSDGWLTGLIRCMRSAPNIGIVGPLSNAASWQNVPQLRDATGSFAVNDLPDGLGVDAMARTVAQVSVRAYPRLPFVNGFCFMISRAVIEAVGYMDELNFPVGYGEENDYCIRAKDAGFELAIADDVFVFHAKSKSFGHERRKTLSEQGTRSLKNKHTVEKYQARVETVKKTEALDAVRARIQSALEQDRSHDGVDLMSMRILFLLPVKGGGGGAHSVVQEVTEMRRLGIDAHVAVKNEQVDGFLKSYADISGAKDTFVGFDDHSLIDLAEAYDVVVGTIFTSMKLVKRIVEIIPHILPAYYVQDYEPMFFHEGTPKWHEARVSYTLVPNAFLFAKTQWIIDEVKRHHGVTVHKVQPSIDHDVYKPAQRQRDGKLHVAAMIRPQTPRRGAARTMRLLGRLLQQHGDRISVHLFGCESEHPDFQRLERGFPFKNHGPLLRPQVARLLGQSDLFIDLSDYQAFGRTALEAMACGCAAVVPQAGGAGEYAIHEVTALVVDTLDEDASFKAVSTVLGSASQLARLQCAGLLTAARYSVHGAAVSEWLPMFEAVELHRKGHKKAARTRSVVIWASPPNDDDLIECRQSLLLDPLSSRRVLKSFRAKVVSEMGQEPPEGDLYVVDLCQELPDLEARLLISGQLRSSGKKVVAYVEPAARPQTTDWTAHIERVARVSNITVAPTSMDVMPKTILPIPTRYSTFPPIQNFDEKRNRSTEIDISKTELKIGILGPRTSSKYLAALESAAEEIQRINPSVAFEWIGTHQDTKARIGKRIGLPRKRSPDSFLPWLIEVADWDIAIILDDPIYNTPSIIDRRLAEYALISKITLCPKSLISGIPFPSLKNIELALETTTTGWIEAIQRCITVAPRTSRKNQPSKMSRIDASNEKLADFYLGVLYER